MYTFALNFLWKGYVLLWAKDSILARMMQHPLDKLHTGKNLHKRAEHGKDVPPLVWTPHDVKRTHEPSFGDMKVIKNEADAHQYVNIKHAP